MGKQNQRRSPAKIMQTHPGGSKTLKVSVRKKSATVVEHEKGPRGGETHYRFPMPDKAHARNALARLPQAKGLSAQEKTKIKSRAYNMLYGTSERPSTRVLRRRSMHERAYA